MSASMIIRHCEGLRAKRGRTEAISKTRLLRLRLAMTIILSVLFSCYSGAGFCEPPKSAQKYNINLEQAVAIAFKNNKDIQIQEQEIIAAQANILGAKSAFLPSVNASASYTYNAGILSIPQVQNSKKDIGVFTGYKNDNRAGVSADQNLYNGGANIANLKQTQVKLKIQEATLRARKLDIEFECKRLYFGLLLAYQTERITQSLFDQARSHSKDVKNKFEQGTASRFDLLQSKVQVSKISPELIKAKNSINIIASELKKLLGLGIDDEVFTQETLKYEPVEIKEGEFLKSAYLNKPEMVVQSLGADVNKWAIELAKAQNRPQVNASLGYNYRSNDIGDMFNNRHNLWNAGLTVSVPIFDAFSSKAKVDQARARYAQANLAKVNLSQQIAVDIRQGCLDLKQAQEVINSQEDNILEAKEALTIANVSYDNGRATNLDVLDAQVSLGQVEKNLSEGIYDYLIAKASLDRSMGKGIDHEDK